MMQVKEEAEQCTTPSSGLSVQVSPSSTMGPFFNLLHLVPLSLLGGPLRPFIEAMAGGRGLLGSLLGDLLGGSLGGSLRTLFGGL